MEISSQTLTLNPQSYKAFSITVEAPDSLLCGYVSSQPGFYFNLIIFDELSFYKWKSKVEVPTLAYMKNVNSLHFFFVGIPKPGKYFLVLQNNAILATQKIAFIFSTLPSFEVDTTNAIFLPDNAWVGRLGGAGGEIELIVNEDEPAGFVCYLGGGSKNLQIKSEKLVNVSVEDTLGVTVGSYQGLKGNKKINIGREISVVKISSSSPAKVFVTIVLPEI